eukprot:6361438-Amphidinium_carterae.2
MSRTKRTENYTFVPNRQNGGVTTPLEKPTFFAPGLSGQKEAPQTSTEHGKSAGLSLSMIETVDAIVNSVLGVMVLAVWVVLIAPVPIRELLHLILCLQGIVECKQQSATRP